MTTAPTAPSLTARVKTRFQRWSRRLLSVSRWLAGGSFGTLAVLSALYPHASHIPGPLQPVFALTLPMMVAAPVVWLAGQLARLMPFREAQVAASPMGLDVTRDGRVRSIPAATITLGVVVPRMVGAELRLLLTNGDELAVRVPSVEAGDALLAGLALDPHQRRTDVEWNPLLRRASWAALGFFVTVVALVTAVVGTEGTPMAVPAVFLLAVVPFLVASALARAMRNRVSVGRAGVVARDGVHTRQLGFDDVIAVRHVGEQLQLVREGAEPFVVSMHGLEPSVAKQLVERMAQGLIRFRELVGSRAEIFARGGRDFEAWKEDVRRVLTEAVGFRGAALRPEDALRVVEDPEADPEARVGAALALMAVGGDDEKLRVRVAAETTLAPRVRIALEAASEGDVEEDVIAAAVREREV
ncbi:MAG: hypothetical protein KBB95_09250 [Deltaproteobacteria bacterium]|nr:hypothetical protein [Deltaproteobacteria bacterium]